MIELTVQVPEELVQRLSPIREGIPQLLQQIDQILPAMEVVQEVARNLDLAIHKEAINLHLPQLLQQIDQILPAMKIMQETARDLDLASYIILLSPQAIQQISQVSVVGLNQETVPNLNLPLYNEVINFILTQPSAEEIAKFKVSESTQARLRELLEKNREDELNASEKAELDAYQEIGHLMILLKARAHNTAV